MIKKLSVTGFVVVAAAGLTLLSAPAYADTDNRNSSRNDETSQSGNNFANIGAANFGGRGSTNVNNINGNAAVASDDSRAGFGVRVD
ncbi:hypothetical protein ACIBQX_26780 [Nonomuraea sp. NPDC049714]|jgi:hypothetical protein|uniref:hypothetical protein n=1 Tax=unclassified Nonomuraea TaxID=2593643 RepID=UPI0037BC12DC